MTASSGISIQNAAISADRPSEERDRDADRAQKREDCEQDQDVHALLQVQRLVAVHDRGRGGSPHQTRSMIKNTVIRPPMEMGR